MACKHNYKPLPTTYPSGHKSVAQKRCTRCGKTVETYLWLKVLIALIVIGAIVAAVISYLDSIPAQ